MPVFKKGYTFADVVLVPQYTNIKSRMDVSVRTKVGLNHLVIPIIASNMDTVCADKMAIAMAQAGGMGILHRYAEVEEVLTWIKNINDAGFKAVPSIGAQKVDAVKAEQYQRAGCTTICVDVAHGDHEIVTDMVTHLKGMGFHTIIAGNVATGQGALRLFNAGADVIKVGIGPGSICQTRVQTGNGVPQLTAIMDCVDMLKKVSQGKPVQVIADGGITSSGDIVKALAAGATAVMLGSLLAGTDETPGMKLDGYKVYRGMASSEAMQGFGLKKRTAEGVAAKVVCKGPVANVLEDLVGGLRSGMTYQNARNLQELQEDPQFMEVSVAGFLEGTPHIKK